MKINDTTHTNGSKLSKNVRWSLCEANVIIRATYY